MNIKVCIVLLAVCVAMAAGSSFKSEILRKLIMKRLNEGKSVRKALPNGFLGNKRMLGANGAGQQSMGDLQQALTSFRMSLIDYADKYGTDAAVRLIDRIGRLVDGVVADTTNDGEGTADNAAENEGTTEATETTVSEITDKPTESYTPEQTTEETTERNTTETSEVSTEPDTEPDEDTTDTPDVPETADLLRALLRNLRLNRKK
ncbi:uncharacterized protein LOC132740934 [Ruditapes philippinarum]|uniref:uncharacterized protein LOC132740934 n=1 Tax=Ruditapes philippinarum TaxID=129788 RepID=UPI00295C0539|nr:uncharacterized protein LOC132740934 [Ruditapes philippinarum]